MRCKSTLELLCCTLTSILSLQSNGLPQHIKIVVSRDSIFEDSFGQVSSVNINVGASPLFLNQAYTYTDNSMTARICYILVCTLCSVGRRVWTMVALPESGSSCSPIRCLTPCTACLSTQGGTITHYRLTLPQGLTQNTCSTSSLWAGLSPW